MNRLIRKPLFLCAVISLALPGCHPGNRASVSPARQKVTAVSRADLHSSDHGKTYADKLHQSLVEGNIEHKVVTFSYGWDSNLDGIRRTVVIYRDTTNRKFPWWAMDQHLDRPVWLSNETTARQVQFLARRPATVVEEKYYPAIADGGKNIREVEKARHAAGAKVPNARPAQREGVTRIQPVSDAPKAKPGKPPRSSIPTAVKAEPTSQVSPPKPALIGKETSESQPPKVAPKPNEAPAGKPERTDRPDQLAPLPIAPPSNVKEPKPIVPKPVPKLRTRPSELDVPKPPNSSRRRGFFEWLFALL